MSGPTDRSTAAPARRLLLFSYHFPPMATAGAQRWGEMAMFAVQRGFLVDVICADVDGTARQDRGSPVQASPGVRVVRVAPRPPWVERVEDTIWVRVKQLVQLVARSGMGARRGSRKADSSSAPIGRPESLSPSELRWPGRRRADWRRAHDAALQHLRDARWARDALASARSLAQRTPYDVVVSCGPPHMAHDAARRFAGEHRCPLVLDFRDPWALRRRLPEAYASPLYFVLARRRERLCVDAAALVVTNTAQAADGMRAQHPGARFLTIMNGVDGAPIPAPENRPRFEITYAGGVYLDRDPRPLMRAVRLLVDRTQASPSTLRLRIIGPSTEYGGVPMARLAEAAGVAEHTEVVPTLPRQALEKELLRASVLVSLPQDSPYAVPSKLYEYMRFPAWILAFAPEESPSATILAGRAAVVGLSDHEGAAAALSDFWQRYLSAEKPVPLAEEPEFSRGVQAGRLFDALDAVTSGSTAAPDLSAERSPSHGRRGT